MTAFSGYTVMGNSASTAVSYLLALSLGQVIAIEKALRLYIAALPRMLMRKEFSKHPDTTYIIQALPRHLDRAAYQTLFPHAANKTLGRSGKV